MSYTSQLPVWPGAGRHVEHDERSRAYPAVETAPRSILHTLYAAPIDQGSLGSCTGSAAVNLLNCSQFAPERKHANGTNRYLTQQTAVGIYSQATRIDPFPGSYPPTDTGSSGLAVAKILRLRGYVRAYTHAFGLEHLLATLPIQPVMVGTSWYEFMTFPVRGRIGAHSHWVAQPRGRLLGGHEYVCIGVNLAAGYLTFVNSWGRHWPAFGANGRFVIGIEDFRRLLDDDGDVTVPVGWL